MTFTHKFKQDFEILYNKIGKENFAFARYADGEYHAMNGIPITGCDGWQMKEDYKVLASLLKTGFNHTESNYFYGISCPCCDRPRHEWFRNNLKQYWDHVTFSNLFVNANYNQANLSRLYDKFNEKSLLFSPRPKITLPFTVLKSTNEDVNSLDIFENKKYPYYKEYYQRFARINNDKIFLFAVGPVSEVLIHLMYTENPNNTYIDIGSMLDPYIHGKNTRAYHTTSEFSNRECHF